MGYRRSKTYTLAWDDGEFAGLEVVVRSVPTGRYLEILDTLAGEGGSQLQGAVDAFSSVLVSWNLEDESGQPVPATHEGVLSVDLELLTELVKAWQDVTTGRDVPKGETSHSGAPSPELSMPMEALSPSLAI